VILDLIGAAKADGLPTERACGVVGLSPRTIQRWQAPTPSTPDPVATPSVIVRPRPYNALTASEAAAVIALIRSPKHVDGSCRELALALQESPVPTYVSHVTVWQYECRLNCNGPRGRQASQGRRRTAPDTDWVNGPNQLWDWDITYLHTQEPRVFLYLYSLLDHWSRKNVAWRISSQLISAEVQTLWDHGLINEGLLDQPAHTWPKSLSDRGVQMRSRSTATYFQKLGIPQLFSRPRTPDDNPYIEAHFATIKTQPAFPGRFADQVEAEEYFSQFYPWYNDVHPHTRLNMLTPSQVHSGQGPRHLHYGGAYCQSSTRCVRLPVLLVGGAENGSRKKGDTS
jgi:transposase InsO family protein